MFHKVEPCQQNNYILSYWLSHSESFTSFLVFFTYLLDVKLQLLSSMFYLMKIIGSNAVKSQVASQ